jgi:hypothetical protein
MGTENKTLRQGIAPRAWMETAPTRPGVYHFTSVEIDGDWEVLRVDTWLAFRWRDDRAWAGDPWGRRIGLYVDCPHQGVTAVTDYHNGLTEPRWRWLGNPIGNRNKTQLEPRWFSGAAA